MPTAEETAALATIRGALEAMTYLGLFGPHGNLVNAARRALDALPVLERALAEREEAAKLLGTVVCIGTLSPGEYLANAPDHAATQAAYRLKLERDAALAPGVGLRPAREVARTFVNGFWGMVEKVPGDRGEMLVERLTACIESDRQSRPAGRRGALREDTNLSKAVMAEFDLTKADWRRICDIVDQHLASGPAPGKEPSGRGE
jgi:hypothetical protein